MTAPSARGKKPRNGNTAKMVALIRSSKAGVTSPELAAHVGILVKQVAPLLHDYVQRGELVTCIVQRPGQRDCTLYRDGSGKAAAAKGWKGQSFPVGADRKIRGKSLTAADIPGATPPSAPILPKPEINTGGGDIAAAEPSAADSAHDQPEVSRNTGSAAGTTPLSAGPRRKKPASKDSAHAETDEAGDVRYSIRGDGQLLLGTDTGYLVLRARDVRDLASFLAGTRGIWSATP